MDPLITGANVLRNKLAGLFSGMTSGEVRERLARGEELFLLDVRSPLECAQCLIPEAVNIPLGKVRSSLDLIPRDRPVVCFCAVSLRGYEAARMLQHAGYDQVHVMEGGMAMWTPPF
jgi:rhodanese-related sulfurtransferase